MQITFKHRDSNDATRRCFHLKLIDADGGQIVLGLTRKDVYNLMCGLSDMAEDANDDGLRLDARDANPDTTGNYSYEFPVVQVGQMLIPKRCVLFQKKDEDDVRPSHLL